MFNFGAIMKDDDPLLKELNFSNAVTLNGKVLVWVENVKGISKRFY